MGDLWKMLYMGNDLWKIMFEELDKHNFI